MWKDLLSDKHEFRVTGRIWVESADDRFLGPGRIELLEKIAEFGSIAKAAQAMGMSYKKAWDLTNSMNNQAAQPLVTTQTGGKQGGGARVSEAGLQAIAAYKALQERFQQFMEAESKLFKKAHT